MNIYEIQKDYLELLSEIEDNEGYISDELHEKLKQNEDDLNIKVGNYVKMIRHFDADFDSIKKEMDRLKKLKEAKERSIESLKEVVSGTLLMRGIKKLDLGTTKISFRKSEALIVQDEDSIPSAFKETRVTEHINKLGLKQYIKDGNLVEGAFVEERENLQIK